MTQIPTTPGALARRLTVYFGALIALLVVVAAYSPRSLDVLPIGGMNLDLPGAARDALDSRRTLGGSGIAAIAGRFEPALALVASLAGTIVLMIPITWVYMATRFKDGFRKAFVVALILLPICATTTVLLIQDSLPLAFGLAALVTAVRFRVGLPDALDAIYIFAAICVGLASGVGYLGVAIVAALFFCYAGVLLWHLEYGTNPVELARKRKKQAKLEHDKSLL